MVIKVYVSMISCSQEVKKNQQRAIMILESKNIAFTTLDITDPGQEDSKDYMNENARPKGDNKVPMTPQLFNEADYCGDFDDLDMANETDSLGEFLKLTEEEKKGMKIGITGILPEDRARAEQKKKKDGLTNGVSAGREMENVNVANDVDAVKTTTTGNPVEAMGETIEAFEDKVNEETTKEDGGDFLGNTEGTEEGKEETVEDTPVTEEGERQTKGDNIVGKEEEDKTETRMENEAEA